MDEGRGKSITPRKFLGIVLALALVAPTAGSAASPVPEIGVVGKAPKKDCLGRFRGIDLQDATIVQINRTLRKGRITSAGLVKAYLERIRAYDGQLNSIRYLNPDALKIARKRDRARDAGNARGPLFGIPVLLKDNVNTDDMPTTAGSIALRKNIPRHDAFITNKLEKAGAIILGKANLSEFAGWVSLGMPPGYSSLAGQVRNAYSPALSPSGSSAGSGVAASMAFATVTIGTETSGSILSPSDANSIVGIKPTTGLVSRTDILPLAPSFDTAGPMVRNVTDAAILLGEIAGVDKADPRTSESVGETPRGHDYTRFLKPKALKGARIGYSEEDRDSLNDQERAVFNRALRDLRKQGAELVATDLLNFSKWAGLVEIGFIPNEFKASLNDYLATETRAKQIPVRTLSDIIEYNERHPKKMKYGQNLLEASDATPGIYDGGVSSQAAIQSARLAIDSALLADDLDAIVAPGPAYANVSASAGYPTVMVPGGYTKGSNVPVGISFLASAYDEPELISFAYDYEQASDRRIPPTHFNARLRRTGC